MYGWLQLEWLEKQLKAAKKNKQNVWIILHIPPGVDAWSTVKEGHMVAYWDALHKDRDSRTFTDKFQELVQMYSPSSKEYSRAIPIWIISDSFSTRAIIHWLMST